MNESLGDDPALSELENADDPPLSTCRSGSASWSGGWNGEPLDARARRYAFVCAPL